MASDKSPRYSWFNGTLSIALKWRARFLNRSRPNSRFAYCASFGSAPSLLSLCALAFLAWQPDPGRQSAPYHNVAIQRYRRPPTFHLGAAYRTKNASNHCRTAHPLHKLHPSCVLIILSSLIGTVGNRGGNIPGPRRCPLFSQRLNSGCKRSGLRP